MMLARPQACEDSHPGLLQYYCATLLLCFQQYYATVLPVLLCTSVPLYAPVHWCMLGLTAVSPSMQMQQCILVNPSLDLVALVFGSSLHQYALRGYACYLRLVIIECNNCSAKNDLKRRNNAVLCNAKNNPRKHKSGVLQFLVITKAAAGCLSLNEY